MNILENNDDEYAIPQSVFKRIDDGKIEIITEKHIFIVSSLTQIEVYKEDTGEGG